MARPRNQAGRRRDLVAAAGRVIVARGVTGLRVRDVAEEARVSPGLVTYYYPSLDELVVDVHADATRRFFTARRSAVDALDDPAEQLAELGRLGVPDGPDDLLCRVLYELHVHGGRSPAHAEMMSSLWEREVSLYELVLARGVERGAFTLQAPVRQVAETVVALEDAVGLHVVTGNRGLTVDAARDLVLGLLRRETGQVSAATS
ncbi:TetR/AcrR family transcriptional regulator [Solicola sp. PLA-1-18]|uniref:TetR/AcrR family transcriptional regulator n=1 Tax=Solicola sp. PLA-1-18 TaxID=3380532 RepID=UPI003B76FDAA